MRLFLLFALHVFLLPTAVQAGSGQPIALDTQTLTQEEQQQARHLIAQALQHLPARMRAQLPPLHVRFDDALPAAVHGRIRGQRIRLARHLLHDADHGPALSALLHELAHAHDRGSHLSRDLRLLDLAGWQVRPRRFGLRGRNRMLDRSPDLYEITSPREFFAVNVEHFLRDPDYPCRRPALFAWLVEKLGPPPRLAGTTCAEGLPFLVPAGEMALELLDPARVYGIDYLLAEPSDALMSRWGHSMLRLVVCAPGRAPGPDCRLDLQHHRVLSFRAFVDDVQISAWHGLSGHYPSRLFVLPLDQVIEEYTATELRGLRSVPLRLSAAEKIQLLQRAAQLHWNYDGRYTFFGNNCASETFKLLHDGVPRLAQQPIAAITPTALLRRLQHHGIADASPLQQADAVALGYYFPAADTHYGELFQIARNQLPDLPARHVQGWLKLPPEKRRPWLGAGDLRSTAALLVLEEAAYRRAQLRARDTLKRQWLRQHTNPLRPLLDDTRELEALLAHPAQLLHGIPGYGLPQAAEYEHASHNARQLREHWHSRSQQLHSLALESLPPRQRQQLIGIGENLQWLGEYLRAAEY